MRYNVSICPRLKWAIIRYSRKLRIWSETSAVIAVTSIYQFTPNLFRLQGTAVCCNNHGDINQCPTGVRGYLQTHNIYTDWKHAVTMEFDNEKIRWQTDSFRLFLNLCFPAKLIPIHTCYNSRIACLKMIFWWPTIKY